MAKLESAPDADDASIYKTVFIDTNLDTHLALIVSDSDTVSDLKKRIQFEHPLCFPNVGKIQIHAIKVKRRGYFYHLSDSMSVSSAFNGINKSWFLSVDASGTGEHGKDQHLLSPIGSNQEVSHAIANNASIGIVDIPLSCPPKRVSSCDNFLLSGFENRLDEKEQVPEQTAKEVLKNAETSVEPSAYYHPEIPSGTIIERQSHRCVDTELPSSRIEGEVDGSSKGVNDECNEHVEGTSKAIPSATKKCKRKRKREDMVHDGFKKNNDAVVEPSEVAIQQTIIDHENSPEKDAGEASMQMGENNIVNGLCVNSTSNTCERSSSDSRRPNEEFEETKVLKEHLECNNDNTKDGIDIDCNESMREPEEPGPANKKHKRRKKSSIHDSKEETLKSEITPKKSDEARKRTEEPRELVEFSNEKSTNDIDLLYNKSSEEAAVTKPSVKKMNKIKENSGDDDLLKENRSIICNSTKEILISENASHHSEDQQKIEGNYAEQPSEHFDGSDPLRTSALRGKRKRKKGLIPHQTVMISSSRNNGETEQSGIEGSDVQDAVSEDGQISKDISMDKASIDKTEMRTGACEEGIIPSEVTETGISKKHVLNVKGRPSNVNEPRDMSEDGKISLHGVTLDACDKSGPCQTDQAEEGREISLKNDPKPILLGNCSLSNQDKADTIIREVTETSKILESNQITEPGKPKKKRRKTRKTKELGGEPELAEAIRPVDVPESEPALVEFHEATNCNPTSGNTEIEENFLNQMDGEDGLQKEVKGNLDEREIDYIKANDVVSSEQIGKTPVESEKKVDEKKRKMSKKKQTSDAKSQSDMVKATLVEFHAATNCDPTSGNTEKVEKLLNQAEGENGPQEEMKGTSDGKEIEYVKDDDAGSSEQIEKTQVDAEKYVDEKRRMISKKKKNSTGKSRSDMVKATSGEFHAAINCNPTSGNTENVDDLLNQTEVENGQQEKGTSDEKEVDYFKANDAGSTEQVEKTQVDTEQNVDEKRKKISQKKQNSTAKSRSDIITKDPKEPLPSSDSRLLVETSSKIAKKNKSAITNATNKSIGSDLQLERDSIGNDPQIPSSIPDGNEKLGPLDANDTVEHFPHSFGNKDDNHLPAPSESNKINDDQHFVSEQQQHEAILPDNMNVDVKLSGKRRQKVSATKGKNQAGTVGSTQLPKAEGDGLWNYSDNKVLKVPIAGQEAPLFSQSHSVASTINKNRKPLKASGKIRQSDEKRRSSIISNTKLGGSKKKLQYKAGKNSANNNWGVVSNTEQKKSLLSRAIFKDDSSGSSEDEVDSNASTSTPPDNSLSSDYSDGKSNAGFNDGKRLENVGRSAILAGSTGMSIDKVLRGSSTFKKAKLTASQLEETDGPLDFVPDSQPNM